MIKIILMLRMFTIIITIEITVMMTAVMTKQ